MMVYGYNKLIKSNTSKLIILMGLLCMLLTAFKYCNVWVVAIQFFIFSSFAYGINCKFYGGCYYSAILPVTITSAITAFLVLDFLGIFDRYKKIIMKFYDVVNEPAEKHFKKILFSGDDQITDRYKNKNIHKLFNIKSKYNTTSNNLDDETVNEFK